MTGMSPHDGLCQCFCKVSHPDTAIYDSCVDAATPGLFIFKRGPLVGVVQIPVCRFCYQAH